MKMLWMEDEVRTKVTKGDDARTSEKIRDRGGVEIPGLMNKLGTTTDYREGF